MHIVLLAFGVGMQALRTCNTTQAAQVHSIFAQLEKHSSAPFERHVVVDSVSLPGLLSEFDDRPIHLHEVPEQLPGADLEVAWDAMQRFFAPGDSRKQQAKARIFLPWILPSFVKQAIMLDLDIIIAGDVFALWALLGNFSAEQAIGMAVEAQPTYINTLFGHTGFNSGVEVLDLEKMREGPYRAILRSAMVADFGAFLTSELGEQSILNAMLVEHVDIFYELPLRWNAQLCDTFWWRGGSGRQKAAVPAPLLETYKKHNYWAPGFSPAILHFNCFGKSLPLLFPLQIGAFTGEVERLCREPADFLANVNRAAYCDILRSIA